MVKTFRILFAVLILGMGMSSCLSDHNDDTTRTDTFVNCFAYVEDVATREHTGFNGLSYDVELNYTKGTAKVVINNLKLADGKEYSKVTLTDLKLSITKENWIEVTASSAEAEIPGSTGKLPISSLELRLCDRMTSTGRIPGFYARYTVDSKYYVLSAARKQYQFGTTTSTSTAGKYETTATDYAVTIDAVAGTMNILMQNTRFVDKMPAMNIVLEKVPFTVSGTTASFNVDEIIPKIGDTPYPGFTITNLSGYYDFSSAFVMAFSCTPETMPLDFKVNVDCKYSFSK